MTRPRTFEVAAWALVAATVLLVAAAGSPIPGRTVVIVELPDQPYCPQEDSCTVDYRDGAWHITEDTP